jgi:exodeoxyribonuclease VII large subunit
MNTDVVTNQELIYSPSAIMNLFNNSLVLKETQRLVEMRGIYLPGQGTSYQGMYYDRIKDEASDAALTLIVPALIRNRLSPNKTISFTGYITKRVVANSGRIELQMNLSDLIEQTHNKYSDEEIKALELLQNKAAIGYRDVQAFIKSKVVNGEKTNIALIIGKTAIIDQDIQHQLGEAIAAYNISYLKVSLTSQQEIMDALERANNDQTDIIIIARGGGDNLEIFNKQPIAEYSLRLAPYFVTAIGHKDDVTLLQQVADKSFITPTALGQFLNDIYNETIDELSNSKAKVIETVTKQLEGTYQKEVQMLNDKIKSIEQLKDKSEAEAKRLHEQEITNLNNQLIGLERLHEQQLATVGNRRTNYTMLLVAALIGAALACVIMMMFRYS